MSKRIMDNMDELFKGKSSFNENISKGNGFILDDVKILGLNSIRKCKSIGVKFD